MKILVVGDSHGNTNFILGAISTAAALNIRTIIQVGDFGVWPGESGRGYLEAINTTLAGHPEIEFNFIDGNHEDFDQLEQAASNPDQVMADGRVKVREHILWCPRGTVLTLDDKKVGFLGGAVSVDKPFRSPYISWWPQENITSKDVEKLFHNTVIATRSSGTPGRLDILFVHDAPASTDIIFEAEKETGRWQESVLIEARKPRHVLDSVVQQTRPKVVVHGHWHQKHYSTATYPNFQSVVYGMGHENETGIGVLDTETLKMEKISL